MSEIKEKGAAAIHVALRDGIITVRHTNEDGPVLQQWTANQGDWDMLWETINTLRIYREPKEAI